MIDDNCIFCKLANGQIPTNSVYENDDFKVILDNAPATKGHALVLPKQHYKNIFEADDEVIKNGILLAKKVGKAMMKELNCDGINIVQNNYEAAGQTIFHLHFHVIPRFDNDSVGKLWKPQEVSDEDLQEVAKVISKGL